MLKLTIPEQFDELELCLLLALLLCCWSSSSLALPLAMEDEASLTHCVVKSSKISLGS